MPPWERLTLIHGDLGVIPRRWRERLADWRGVYFIYDTVRRCGYVGSAGRERMLLRVDGRTMLILGIVETN